MDIKTKGYYEILNNYIHSCLWNINKYKLTLIFQEDAYGTIKPR